MGLNKEQLILQARLREFKTGIFGVTGAGGTGKTYTVCRSIDIKNTLFMGATNKVVNVIKQSLLEDGISGSIVRTIDSVLGFKIEKDENNKDIITYKPYTGQIYHNGQKIDIPNTIVIDEISLINPAKLKQLKLIFEGRKVILLGDNYQLPPITTKNEIPIRDKDGFLVSGVFNMFNETMALTIQNRQKEGTAISTMISEYRAAMNLQGLNVKQTANKYFNQLDVMAIRDINGPEFKAAITGNDDVIAVAYKRMTAGLLGYKIGSIRYNNPRFKMKQIDVGEKAWFDTFYRDEEAGIAFYTTDTIKVISIDTFCKGWVEFGEEGVQYPFTEMIVKPEAGEEVAIRIKQGTATTGKAYYRKQKALKKAKTAGEKAAINTSWQKFTLSFAKLSKPLAITAHKSQGSTFDTVVIPINDFESSKDFRDSKQIVYTAISRAKNRIIFVDVKTLYRSFGSLILTEDEKHSIASANNWKCSQNKCGIEGENVRDFVFRRDIYGNGNVETFCQSCK